MTYIVAQDCIVVKGFARSAIYDLGRQRYYFIPHRLGSIMKSHKLLCDLLNNPKDETEADYASFLLTREIAIPIPESQKKYFRPLRQSWEYPFKIMRCFLKIEKSNGDLKPLLEKLRKENLYEISFLLPAGEADALTRTLEDFYFPGVNLFLHAPADAGMVTELANRYPAYSFYVPEQGLQEGADLQAANITVVPELPLRTVPAADKMYVTISAFMETAQHNLFFNRAIFLKDDGYLYDAFWTRRGALLQSYDLGQIDGDPFFTTTWQADKARTDICRSCEFRRMCNDQRVPLKREDSDTYYHETDCNYNPFIAKWKGEQGYMSQQEIGTCSDAGGYHYDLKKIRKAIRHLWG